MLNMLSFQPDIVRFSKFAARERLLPQGEDTGYAWHAILVATFGVHAPKPFQWFEARTREGGSQGRLLAYSAKTLEELREHAATFADPTYLEILQLADAASKVMATSFPIGQALGFQVRVRPTVRTGADRAGVRGRERDAFDATVDGDRSQRYVAWLRERLEQRGARLHDKRVDALRLTTLLTRSRRDEQTIRRSTLGPDVVIGGTLSVTDPDLFASAITRGIGRHRAFGFGMLLLRPA